MQSLNDDQKQIIFFQTSNRFIDSGSERCHLATSNFSPKPYRKHVEPPEPQTPEKADDRESNLIDLTKMSNDNDLYSADIDFMNNYLKSLPDYSKINNISQQPYTPATVRLREHPTPKPFYNTAAVNDYNARNSHKSSVHQSPKNQRKQINPLSKSNSIHTFSKRNLGQSIEKETTFVVEEQQKNKISRSTSSSTIPAAKEPSSDLMGFMKKPSSLMNIFKKLGSQNPTPSAQSKHQPSNNVRKNVHDVSKTPSMSRTKNIGDFWNENLQQQNSSSNKFGWNYQKIMPSVKQPDAPKPSTPVAVKKLEPIEPPTKPTISNLSKMIPMETNVAHLSGAQPHIHSQHYLRKSQSQSMHHFAKKLTESPKLQRSARADLEHEQKLLKSSSNSHIYMNQDDPNYFKNLHKITKSLDTATSNIIGNNKSSYKRSISNTSVPSYLGSSPQQSHYFCPPPPPNMLMMHPSSVPISFYPPISYKPPQDFHQRSGSKTNIPLCYNKFPLDRSSSNASMMTKYNGTAIGFYSVHDPLLWQATHHINKSSSSSCIYAKTLSQPTHLSKNNDIFAKYKPIVSDDEESESEDDDTSKHSQLSTKPSINRVPAPAPFKKQQPPSSASNYPPFTKLNSIQIPINGQLPSAFKSSVAEPPTSTSKPKEGNVAESTDVSRKNSRASALNANGKPMTSPSSSSSSAPIAIKNSCNQSINNTNNNNFFYNFMNPMAATQTQSINQMHLQQPSDGVGGCYTPYTKYLSDRKYFDVAMSDGMNVVCGGAKPEQRRTSKIPTLTEPQQKAKPAEPSRVATAAKLCDTPIDDDSQTSAELLSTALDVVAPVVVASNEPIAVDPKEILSAFDPYFIDEPEPQPSTSNKLHQLLATVANEWSSGCDHAIATTPSAVMNNCKAYQGDRYGSSQYEVVQIVFHITTAQPFYGLTHRDLRLRAVA